jgi:hypothetical protein
MAGSVFGRLTHSAKSDIGRLIPLLAIELDIQLPWVKALPFPPPKTV